MFAPEPWCYDQQTLLCLPGFNMPEVVGPDCGNGGLECVADWTKEDMWLTKADPGPGQCPGSAVALGRRVRCCGLPGMQTRPIHKSLGCFRLFTFDWEMRLSRWVLIHIFMLSSEVSASLQVRGSHPSLRRLARPDCQLRLDRRNPAGVRPSREEG